MPYDQTLYVQQQLQYDSTTNSAKLMPSYLLQPPSASSSHQITTSVKPSIHQLNPASIQHINSTFSEYGINQFKESPVNVNESNVSHNLGNFSNLNLSNAESYGIKISSSGRNLSYNVSTLPLPSSSQQKSKINSISQQEFMSEDRKTVDSNANYLRQQTQHLFEKQKQLRDSKTKINSINHYSTNLLRENLGRLVASSPFF